MAQLLGGKRDQPWIARGAANRALAQHAGTISVMSLSLAIFCVGLLGYVASLPREVPVPMNEQRDGSWMVYATAVTPDQAGKVKLIADFIGSWRLGCNDPASICARQTSALVSNAPGDSVAKIVRDYNQSVADGGLKVLPTVRYVNGSGTEYVVDWDESVTSTAGAHSDRAMRAFVTIEFGQHYVLLHNDPLMNPYGLFVRDLRVVQIGGSK